MVSLSSPAVNSSPAWQSANTVLAAQATVLSVVNLPALQAVHVTLVKLLPDLCRQLVGSVVVAGVQPLVMSRLNDLNVFWYLLRVETCTS